MTAKEKFYSEIERVGAQRIESIKDADVYAAMVGNTVFIFCHPDCEHWDMYDCGSYWNTLMLPQVLKEAFRQKSIMPEQVATALGDFYAEFTVGTSDMVQAVVWLWNNTCAFDNIWDAYGTLHLEYEDDLEPLSDYEMNDVMNVMAEVRMTLRHVYDVIPFKISRDTQERLGGTAMADFYLMSEHLKDAMRAMDNSGLVAPQFRRYSSSRMWEGSGVYCRSFIERIEAAYWMLYGIKREMDNAMDKDEDAYGGGENLVEQQMYRLVEKFIKDVEELRHMDNANV